MAFNLGDIFVRFKAKAEGFNEAGKKVAEVGDKVKASGDKIGAFGEKASNVGGKLTLGVTTPLIALGGVAIKTANDFNGAMANIGTLIPGNTARINEMKTAIQQMAVDTGKSTSDLANGMYQVVSAFGDSADATKILEVNAKAAKAGLAETTDAINLTSGVTKAYGDTTAEAVQKASDLALMTVRLGQTTFPELAASMGSVTPIAASLKVSQEELFGAMATFTGVTGGASEVSTQLRGVLQGLMAPTTDMQNLMKKLGVANGEAMIKQFGLQGSIEKIVKAAQDSGQPLQKYIGSIEGQTLALAATGGQADAFKEKIAAMGDVAGTTDQAFAEITDGVNKTGFQLEQAKARAEVARQKFGDALAPAVMKVSDVVSNLADKFMNLSPGAQKVVLVIAGLVAALGPALIMIGKMAQGIDAVKKVFQNWDKVMKVISSTSPWFLAILAIAAIAYIIYRNWDTLKQWFGTFWDWVKGIFSAAFNWIKSNWEYLVAAMTGPIGWLVLAIVKNFDTIKAFIGGVIDFIVNIFKFGIDLVLGYFNLLWQGIQFVFNFIWAIISGIWNGITWVISTAIQGWINIISTIIGVVSSVFGTVWNVVSSILNRISGFFGSIWNGITNTVSSVGEGIKNTISNVMEAIKGSVKTAINWVVDKANGIIRGINKASPPGIPEIPEIPKLAKGGIVSKATLAVIGEAGPEAVIPLSKTREFAEDMGVSGGGGAQIIVNGAFARSDSELIDMFEEAMNQLDRRRKAQGKPAIMGG